MKNKIFLNLTNETQQKLNLNFSQVQIEIENAEKFAQTKNLILEKGEIVCINYNDFFKIGNYKQKADVFDFLKSYCNSKLVINQKTQKIVINAIDFLKSYDNYICARTEKEKAQTEKEKAQTEKEKAEAEKDFFEKLIIENKNQKDEITNLKKKIQELTPVIPSKNEIILEREGYKKIEWDKNKYVERESEDNIYDYSFNDIVEIEKIGKWYVIETGLEIDIISIDEGYFIKN